MVSNITMKSEDRKLFGVIIRQQTKTGFLNVSDLTAAYEVERAKKGWSYRDTNDVLKLESNAERIFYILKKRGYVADNQGESIKQNIFGFMKQVKEQTLTKVLKSLKAYKTTGRGENKTVWTDPYIWMLIAMELHPEIYATTVIWLGDKLLLNRIEAGNMYKGLTKAISIFPDVDYKELGKALNFIIFNKNETGIRDTATEQQLKELEDLEKYLAMLIEMGHIESFDKLVEELRAMYNKKWGNIKKISA